MKKSWQSTSLVPMATNSLRIKIFAFGWRTFPEVVIAIWRFLTSETSLQICTLTGVDWQFLALALAFATSGGEPCSEHKKQLMPNLVRMPACCIGFPTCETD